MGAALYAGGLTGIWNGTSWRKEPLPAPGVLEAVSCTSPTFCVAVGSEILSWNGPTWAAQSSPLPDGYLTGVSCSSPVACLAVGWVETPKGLSRPRVERWNGENWSQVANPKRSSVGEFDAVSCSLASACTATGYYRSRSGGYVPLIERWNGSHLVLQQAAQPSSTGEDSIVGVSCPASDGCIAVGNVSPGGPYIEIWNGTTWTAMTSPAIPGSLTGLSCVAITACTAVGRSYVGSGPAVVVQLTGSTWSVQSASAPAGSSGVGFDGVSCPLAASCVAVGGYDSRSHNEKSLAEQWNGSGWAIQAAPNDSMAPQGSFTGLSCSGPDACTAVGSFTSSDGSTVPLGETWDGTRWAVHDPAAAGLYVQPADVSCPAATMCMAVGSHEKGGSTKEYPWAAAWNGTRWVTTPLPGAAGSIYGDQLSAVSCVSATSCLAVGTTSSAANKSRTLAYSWDGTHWTKMTMPAIGYGYLYGVSCSSATWCVAVGGGSSSWLAEAWDGTAWTVQPTSGSPQLAEVSCSSPSACTAVGYADGHNDFEPAAERWDGTSWTAQPPATTPADAEFDGVSCASATACTAVGFYSTGQYSLAPFIQSWDGSGWVTDPVPGTGSSSLTAVSCTSASLCTAAGEQGYGTGAGITETPLAERSG